MNDFSQLYEAVERRVQPDRPTLGLRPRLGAAYDTIIERPYEPRRITAAVGDLLTYLASSEGRTPANCVATDAFFFNHDRWPRSWEEEPADLAAILADIGGLLHDTFHAPSVAENFESTPEQLLARIRAFERAWAASGTASSGGTPEPSA